MHPGSFRLLTSSYLEQYISNSTHLKVYMELSV